MALIKGQYPDIPWIAPSDLRIFGAPTWESLDDVASAWIGQRCQVLPSIRVGLCWVLEQRGYARYRDHVLVPRFMGRCILNSLSRFALPVESPTSRTRFALVVDQFGRRQDTKSLYPYLKKNGWEYIEDSPYGVGSDETPASGSLGRFIGLSKVLPVAQGALFVAGNEEVARVIERNRRKTSPWGLPVWLAMLLLRKRNASNYSEVADAIYELYPAARGGSRALRANIEVVFKRISWFERESKYRIDLIEEILGDHVIIPDQRKLGYLVPFLPGAAMSAAKALMKEAGFSDVALHVDMERNMLVANYVKSLPIPINPNISRKSFEHLVLALSKLPDLDGKMLKKEHE